jgi:hypothetical protein
MATTGGSSGAQLRLPEPSRTRPPMKANVFHHSRTAVTALCPMFPYMGEGCIVPVVAAFRAAPGRVLGMFKHFNTEDEILTVFGASGLRFKAGFTLADVRSHLVNITFTDPADPNNFACFGIVQRQAEKRAGQKEAVTFICEKCQKPLTEYAFTWSAPVGSDAIGDEFESPLAAARAAERFNKDPELRTCKHCGHVSASFPEWEWGWGRYAERCGIVQQAVRTYPGLQAPTSTSQETIHG